MKWKKMDLLCTEMRKILRTGKSICIKNQDLLENLDPNFGVTHEPNPVGVPKIRKTEKFEAGPGPVQN